MSVGGSISGALRRFGRPITLRRNKLGPGGVQIPLDVTVYGAVKGYQPNQLIGNIKQGDSEVTISNVEILAAQWPEPPIAGDQMIIDGKTRTLTVNPDPKYLGTEFLIYICSVTG